MNLRLNTKGFGYHILLPIVVVIAVGIIGLLTLRLSNAATGSKPSNADFTIVSMPDTQAEVINDVKRGGKRGLVTKDMQWIVNNKSSYNIQVVVGPGDLTHAAGLGSNNTINTKIKKMWNSISKSYKVLDDAGVAYVITNGNHDTAANSLKGGSSWGAHGEENKKSSLYRDTSLFNATFPVTRSGLQGLTLKDTGRVENSYRTFRVKNTNWLILAMEYAPRGQVVEWAKGVIASHPTHNVVIATHQYYTNGGTELYKTCDADECVPSQAIHDELVMAYPNVKMLFSGHTMTENTKVETSASGNKVIQYKTTMHACMGQPCRNPIRIVKIDLTNASVTADLCKNVSSKSTSNCSSQTVSAVQFVTSDTE